MRHNWSVGSKGVLFQETNLKCLRELPGSLVVRILGFNCWGPGQGTKIPCREKKKKKRFRTPVVGWMKYIKKHQHLLSPECCFISFHPFLMKQLYFFLITEKAPLLGKKVVVVGVERVFCRLWPPPWASLRSWRPSLPASQCSGPVEGI